MPNIHTIHDKPNSQPLPDPWKAHPKKPVYSDEYDLEYSFPYSGIDGKTRITKQATRPTALQICCLGCFPCFWPPFCSQDKKEQYWGALKTFCVLVSFAQIILLIVSLGMGGFAKPSDNPQLGPPTHTLITLGAKDGFLMKEEYEVWRFVTPIFLHAGFIHIILNLMTQLRFGIQLEAKWGTIRFIILYFLSGIGGVLLSSLVKPHAISVGASGALMGLMGAFLAEALLSWNKTDQTTRKVITGGAIVSIVIIMLLSLSPNIDFFGHLGGLLVGFFVGMVYFSKELDTLAMSRISFIGGIGILVVYFVVGFALFYTVVDVE